MAIREFESINPNKGCDRCNEGFELYQKMSEDLITNCPHCGCNVKQIMSMNSFHLIGSDWTRRGI